MFTININAEIHIIAEPERTAEILAQLSTLSAHVSAIRGEVAALGALMSEQLDRLTTEVSESTSVMSSAATLIAGLAQQIRDNATDPAALTALADRLDSATNDLAAAVAANTPATPTPETPAPTPEPAPEGGDPTT